jgi:hypothetical protein
MQTEFRAIVQSEYGAPEKVLTITRRQLKSEELGADRCSRKGRRADTRDCGRVYRLSDEQSNQPLQLQEEPMNADVLTIRAAPATPTFALSS